MGEGPRDASLLKAGCRTWDDVTALCAELNAAFDAMPEWQRRAYAYRNPEDYGPPPTTKRSGIRTR